MSLDEAYQLLLNKVQELKDAGIEVIIEKLSENPKKHHKDAIKEYAELPGRLSYEKWITVKFRTGLKEHLDLILDAKKYLSLCGISFDTYGDYCLRAWQCDWSFNFTKGQTDQEHINVVEDVEYQIRSCIEKR